MTKLLSTLTLAVLLVFGVMQAHSCATAYRDVDGRLDVAAMQLDLEIARDSALEIAGIYEPVDPELAEKIRDAAEAVDDVIAALASGSGGELASIDGALAALTGVTWSDDPDKQVRVEAVLAAARVALRFARRSFE
jgi:hypothetical protein